MRGIGEYPLHGAFGQFSRTLILLFHDPDSKSGSYVRAILPVHLAAISS